MLKNISRLEVVIGAKIYHLLCDSDSPLEHVKEAVFQFGKYVGQIEDQLKANVEANKPIEEVQPPVEQIQPSPEEPKPLE